MAIFKYLSIEKLYIRPHEIPHEKFHKLKENLKRNTMRVIPTAKLIK